MKVSETDEDTIMSLKMNNQESHAIPDARQVHCPKNRHRRTLLTIVTSGQAVGRERRLRDARSSPWDRRGTGAATPPPPLAF
jgi:hypothetical protein